MRYLETIQYFLYKYNAWIQYVIVSKDTMHVPVLGNVIYSTLLLQGIGDEIFSAINK